jgi:S-adenosylmethionine decarboxylase
MLLKDFDIDNYLFGAGSDEFEKEELEQIEERLRTEMLEIFYSRNMG